MHGREGVSNLVGDASGELTDGGELFAAAQRGGLPHVGEALRV